MKTFQSKSLLESRTVGLLKGLTLLFLGASVAVLATYGLSIDPAIGNASMYIQKIILTSDGSASGATGAVLNGNGNAYFAGNVGIGTTSPSVRLEVSSGDFVVNNGFIGLYTNGSPSSFFATTQRQSNQINTGDTILVSLLGNMKFVSSYANMTAGIPSMTLTTGGNVGIGTSMPTGLFHLYKGSDLDLNIQTPADMDQKINFISDDDGLMFQINNDLAYNKFSLNAVHTSTSITFGTSGSVERMRIANDGNVGIGATDPQAKLDVNGAIRLRPMGDPPTSECTSQNEGEMRYYSDGISSYSILFLCMRTDPNYIWTPIITTCFTPNMRVALYPSGYKAIGEIQIGDVLKSFDPEFNVPSVSKVEKVITHQANAYLLINDKLEVTPNHHMYINNQWMEVGDAKLGDYFLNETGEKVYIYSIVNKTTANPTTVYNLLLDEGDHNYFVEGMLAHNKCPFLYSYGEGGQLVYENTFIYNIDGKDKETTQIRELRNVTNKFMIKELEPETSYIDSMYLLAELKSGEKVKLQVVNNPLLQKNDGKYLITNQGDSVAIEFESLPKGTVKTYIMAKGYYIYHK